MQLEFRRATMNDATVIAQFNAAMALETENLTLDRERVRRGVEVTLRDPAKGFYVLAVAEEKVIAQTMITFEWSDWSNGMRWWVQSVYVHPDYRGRGIYRGLFEYLRGLAREAETVFSLRLYVHNENRGAQAVYQKLGFHETKYDLYQMDLPRSG
ncbi:MAG: GNAT family N-acetyltransferase [Acidobacteria bacterium]|nr:GNAT family N-acetyltransferase [Acidobacteriota bacterium]